MYLDPMSDEEIELPFTLFVACAQLIVGIGLIAFAPSSAVRIIGVVVIAFALLTGGSAWYHARQRGLRAAREADEADDAQVGEAGDPQMGEAGDPQVGEAGKLRAGAPPPQSSQGPRQPPRPEGTRSASLGPHDPGA
jgi:hypothetical protein